jgi:hypothetical protein
MFVGYASISHVEAVDLLVILAIGVTHHTWMVLYGHVGDIKDKRVNRADHKLTTWLLPAVSFTLVAGYTMKFIAISLYIVVLLSSVAYVIWHDKHWWAAAYLLPWGIGLGALGMLIGGSTSLTGIALSAAIGVHALISGIERELQVLQSQPHSFASKCGVKLATIDTSYFYRKPNIGSDKVIANYTRLFTLSIYALKALELTLLISSIYFAGLSSYMSEYTWYIIIATTVIINIGVMDKSMPLLYNSDSVRRSSLVHEFAFGLLVGVGVLQVDPLGGTIVIAASTTLYLSLNLTSEYSLAEI